MKIDRNSYGIIAGFYLGCAAVIFVLLRYVHLPWLSWPLSAGLVWVCVWQTCFFRVPKRRRCGNGREVSSVADGKVVIVELAFESEYLKRDCLQVSVYMNFFDVHANFWPVDGRVSHYRYYPGEHFLAFKPKASLENEHTCTCIITDDGNELLFKQIAGGFARRIVNYAGREKEARAGEQCGIIKFGSRIDVFLPLDAKVLVSPGQIVRACETILAELPPAPASAAPLK